MLQLWTSYDKKLDQVLSLNKEIAYAITRKKLNQTILSLRLPKSLLLLLGIPYALILCFITWIAFKAGALFVMLGFGTISLIMIATIIGYVYHLFLISNISRTEEIVAVQKQIGALKISSFNIARLAILQLPFWSICWISTKALVHDPLVYGGINLLVFLGLAYISYWLYQNLSLDKPHSKISKLVFSGGEWEPIVKSAEILEQLEAYEKS